MPEALNLALTSTLSRKWRDLALHYDSSKGISNTNASTVMAEVMMAS